MKFDSEKVRQGLGCLTDTAPLVKSAEFYHNEVVEPEIKRLTDRLNRLETALEIVKSEAYGPVDIDAKRYIEEQLK